MITGWMLKLVLSIALAGALIFEVASPQLTKAQLDDRAHNAGSAAWREIRDGHGQERAVRAAHESGGDDITNVEFLPDGTVRVTMKTTARSLFVRKYIKKFASYYEVEITTITP